MGEVDGGSEAANVAVAEAPDHLNRVARLGRQLHRQFERTGSRDDLNHAIEAMKTAVDATSQDELPYVDSLNSLGMLLHTRFLMTGSINDLNYAIELGNTAKDIISLSFGLAKTVILNS